MIKLAILAGLTSVVMVMLAGQTKIIFAMAEDDLLPSFFKKVSKTYGTPMLNVVSMSLFGGALSAFLPVDVLSQLVSMGTLFGFFFVCLGVIVMRYTHPELHRPFKTPFFPWIPILGAGVCLTQMLLLPGAIWVQLLIWIGIGCMIFFAYSHKSDRLEAKL